MNYIDLRLGDFLTNIVLMSNIVVYDTYDDTALFHARVGGSGLKPSDITDTILEDNVDLNKYIINYVTSTDDGIEIGVIEE
jgi:hypothetical protein